MENKKLLKYLLKDLSELDEMFSEKEKNSFDDLEMEFIQNRISGAKKLIQLIIDHENEVAAEKHQVLETKEKSDSHKSAGLNEEMMALPEEKLPGKIWVEVETAAKVEEINTETKITDVVTELKPEVKSEEQILAKIPGTAVTEGAADEEPMAVLPEVELPQEENLNSVPFQEKVEEVVKNEPVVEMVQKPAENKRAVPVQGELQLEEEAPVDIHNKRLGDSFLKEKSVNDIIGDDLSKLEHKLSNRPVTSIQAAIGINDRFQYIRELFEGSSENFSKTVADLDSMSDLKEAVNYLQNHFKWKKNETSLKFVNLIKRRFPNE